MKAGGTADLCGYQGWRALFLLGMHRLLLLFTLKQTLRFAVLVGCSLIYHSSEAAELKTVGVVCHCRDDFISYKKFETGLLELGWREGEKTRIIRRFSDGDQGRLDRIAEEIVGLKPDVIFAGFTPAVVAVQKLTTAIPVVFAGVSDASEIGAASHYNKPEHNFTGPLTINRELMGKRLEILKEAFPGLSTVGYLANLGYALHKPQLEEMQRAAERLGLKLTLAEISDPLLLNEAFANFIAGGAQAVVVQQDPLLTGQSARIVAFAEAHRLPAICALRTFYGGLIWYGADITSMFHRAAYYIDKVLKGAHPSDLPVERPAKVYLTVNLKLARRIAVSINPSVLARADEVIE
jgi:putative ABC transport system substrate-binding protein